MISVDTSVLIDLFKGARTSGAQTLRQLEEDDIPFAVPAICAQEVLAGARDEPEWDLLLSYLETQRLMVPREPWSTHRGAARIMLDCRRKGLTIRSSVDCLIAQLALEGDHALLHRDADFDRIAQVRPLRAWSP